MAWWWRSLHHPEPAPAPRPRIVPCSLNYNILDRIMTFMPQSDLARVMCISRYAHSLGLPHLLADVTLNKVESVIQFCRFMLEHPESKCPRVVRLTLGQLTSRKDTDDDFKQFVHGLDELSRVLTLASNLRKLNILQGEAVFAIRPAFGNLLVKLPNIRTLWISDVRRHTAAAVAGLRGLRHLSLDLADYAHALSILDDLKVTLEVLVLRGSAIIEKHDPPWHPQQTWPNVHTLIIVGEIIWERKRLFLTFPNLRHLILRSAAPKPDFLEVDMVGIPCWQGLESLTLGYDGVITYQLKCRIRQLHIEEVFQMGATIERFNAARRRDAERAIYKMKTFHHFIVHARPEVLRLGVCADTLPREKTDFLKLIGPTCRFLHLDMCEHGNVADVLLWLEELPHLLSSSELVYFALMVDNVPRAVHFRDREILMQFVADLMSRCKCLEVVEVHWPSEPALGHSWWRREEPQLVEIEEDVFEINEDLAIEISEGLGKAIRAQHWHEDPQDHPFGARMEKLIT